MNKSAIYLVCLMFFSLSVQGQKYKYKDIFPALDQKNYAEAEPKLRAFLKESKNEEHPNAHFQMAYLLEHLMKPLNVVNDSSAVIKYCDSVALYFSKAKQLITEKEVKKKKDYYQAYYRRDLRTGEFGIKKSDIDVDIDKKVNFYRDVRRNVQFLAITLPKLEKVMTQNAALYKELVEGFDNVTSFAISVDKEKREQLQQLAVNNRTTRRLVNDIQDCVARLPEGGFNSDEDLQDVEDITTDGGTANSVYDGKFQLWDYEQFANDVLELADGDIATYKKSLLETNSKLNVALKKLEKYQAPTELPMVPEDLMKQAAQIDPDNLPVSILQFKAAEARYLTVELNEVEDVNYVYLQMQKFDSLNEIVKAAKVHFEQFAGLNTPLEQKKYKEFIIKAFNRQTQLDQFVKDKRGWINNRVFYIGQQTDELKERIKWGSNDVDSVALFTNPEGQLADKMTTFLETDSLYYNVVAGLEFDEEPYKAFIGRVAPNMSLLWKYTLDTEIRSIDSIWTKPLDSLNYFKQVPGDRALTTCYFTADQQVYQFLAFDKESGTVRWQAKVKTEQPVFDVRYNELTKETVVYLEDPEILEQGGEIDYVVIDKSGKVRK